MERRALRLLRVEVHHLLISFTGGPRRRRPPRGQEQRVARRLEGRHAHAPNPCPCFCLLPLRLGPVRPVGPVRRRRQHVRVAHGEGRERPRQAAALRAAVPAPLLLLLLLLEVRRLRPRLGLLEEGVELPPRVEARQLLPPPLPLQLRWGSWWGGGGDGVHEIW